MARQKPEPRHRVVQTHFTDAEYERLREYAYKNRYSMSEILRTQTLEFLDRMEAPDEDQG